MSLKYVIMHYGPVESFNLGPEQKPQFVYGVRDRLLRLGYRVDLKPVQTINCFLLEMCGYKVFQCNIKNLAFNMSHKRDPVGQLALKAVRKAEAKLSRAREYLWIRDFATKFFKHLEHAKDFSINATTIGSIASMNTCADCCGILRKPDISTLDAHPQISRISSVDVHSQNMSRAFTHEENTEDNNLPSKSMDMSISLMGRLNEY